VPDQAHRNREHDGCHGVFANDRGQSGRYDDQAQRDPVYLGAGYPKDRHRETPVEPLLHDHYGQHQGSQDEENRVVHEGLGDFCGSGDSEKDLENGNQQRDRR
jgi:hypothetical protein